MGHWFCRDSQNSVKFDKSWIQPGWRVGQCIPCMEGFDMAFV